MTKKLSLLGVALALVFTAGVALAEEEAERVGDAYTLKVCALSGKELGSMGEPAVHVVDGREVRFCCGGCLGGYKEDKEAKDIELDAAMTKDQKPYYPLTTCVKAGRAVEGGGESFVVGNRLVTTCCSGCKKAVVADPAEYIAKLDQAVIKAQSEDYPLELCPISGKAIGEGAKEIVVANRLVKLCCGGCEKGIEKDPTEHLSKLDEAWKEAGLPKPSAGSDKK